MAVIWKISRTKRFGDSLLQRVDEGPCATAEKAWRISCGSACARLTGSRSALSWRGWGWRCSASEVTCTGWLDLRIGSMEVRREEVAPWQARRNQIQATVN